MRIILSFLIILVIANSSFAADKSKGILKIGDMIPESLGEDLKGNKIIASDHRGKIMVISFWATWCPPCRKELPIIDNLQRIVGKEKISVIAVNYGEPIRTFRKFTKLLGDANLTFSHDSKGKISKKEFGVTAIPHMVIVDHTGTITQIHTGYGDETVDNIANEINDLLGKQPKTNL